MKSRTLHSCAFLLFAAAVLLTWWMLAQPLAWETQAELENRSSLVRAIKSIEKQVGSLKRTVGEAPSHGKEDDAFGDIVVSYGNPVIGEKSTRIDILCMERTFPHKPVRIDTEETGESLTSRSFPMAVNEIVFSPPDRSRSDEVSGSSKADDPAKPMAPQKFPKSGITSPPGPFQHVDEAPQ